MNLSLGPEAEKLIRQNLENGRFVTAEEVVLAALTSLDQQTSYGDFAPGELDELVAEGERSIEREGEIDADAVFAEIHQRSLGCRTGRREANRRVGQGES
jgi:Arc/MetJ-type ribon-helix-helix transcriptional regulator